MSSRPLRILRASTLGASVALAAMASSPAGHAASPTLVAMSALGDLGPYNRIASDTLALVDKGDIPAARTRVKDLETSWDKAEATLKAKDKATWTTVDDMIDAALADLRTPNPKVAACQASLKALIAKMDALDKA